MEAIRVEDVVVSVTEVLGVSGQTPDSTEVISALLRCAAGFRCPCKRRTLVDEAMESLRGMNAKVEREKVKTTLEALLAYGDLIEAETRSDDADVRMSQVYARPPSFLRRSSGDVLLLGVGELDQLPLPLGLQSKVEYRGHARRLGGEDVASRLEAGGFIEIAPDAWGWRPDRLTPEGLLSQYDARLDAAPQVRDVIGFRVLDSVRPVDFYPGRWLEVPRRSGKYLARRPRKYGSDLWGYALVEAGSVIRLVDIIDDGEERACDQAWRLQMAVDHTQGHPQRFSIRTIEGRESKCLSLYSPVPQWAQRRWDSLGTSIDVWGALLSYELASEDVDDEVAFCSDTLWLEQVDKGPARERMGD